MKFVVGKGEMCGVGPWCWGWLQAISNIFEMTRIYKILAVLGTFRRNYLAKMMDLASSIDYALNYINKELNILIYFMQTSNNSMSFKRRYSYISIKKRELLVKEVLNDGKSLSKTSKRLNIRLSTAKLILKKFKLHGRFFMKKTQHRRGVASRNLAEEETPRENDRQSKMEQKVKTVQEMQNHNTVDQMVQGEVEETGYGGYLIYYPSIFNLGWNGWNIMPVAFLQ